MSSVDESVAPRRLDRIRAPMCVNRFTATARAQRHARGGPRAASDTVSFTADPSPLEHVIVGVTGGSGIVHVAGHGELRADAGERFALARDGPIPMDRSARSGAARASYPLPPSTPASSTWSSSASRWARSVSASGSRAIQSERVAKASSQ